MESLVNSLQENLQQKPNMENNTLLRDNKKVYFYVDQFADE